MRLLKKIRSWATKEIGEAQMIPRGYGAGRRDYRRRVLYCHPIPLNIVFVALDEIALWLIKPKWEGKWWQVYQLGYDAARKHDGEELEIVRRHRDEYKSWYENAIKELWRLRGILNDHKRRERARAQRRKANMRSKDELA